jgi:hypothetical protein
MLLTAYSGHTIMGCGASSEPPRKPSELLTAQKVSIPSATQIPLDFRPGCPKVKLISTTATAPRPLDSATRALSQRSAVTAAIRLPRVKMIPSSELLQCEPDVMIPPNAAAVPSVPLATGEGSRGSVNRFDSSTDCTVCEGNSHPLVEWAESSLSQAERLRDDGDESFVVRCAGPLPDAFELLPSGHSSMESAAVGDIAVGGVVDSLTPF